MLFIVKVCAAAPTLCLAQHLFVDLPFFQLVDPIPQQWAFVCHSSERSEGEVQKKKKKKSLHVLLINRVDGLTVPQKRVVQGDL